MRPGSGYYSRAESRPDDQCSVGEDSWMRAADGSLTDLRPETAVTSVRH